MEIRSSVRYDLDQEDTLRYEPMKEAELTDGKISRLEQAYCLGQGA